MDAVAAGLPFRRPALPAAQRSRGALRLAYARRGRETALVGAFRAGASRILEPAGPSPVAEGVLINTAGGVVGGDRFETTVEVGREAGAFLTTQACEKIYRAASDDPDAEIATRAEIAAGGSLTWLPQPTILFDRARLSRRIEVDMDESARCLALESVILGREAMGETVGWLSFLDAWRIRRGGRLAFAEATRLRGDAIAAGGGPATLGGARAFALLVLLAPDADRLLDPVRAVLDDVPATAGASAWNGLLSVRIVAADGLRLTRALAAVVPVLSPEGVPRMWSI